MNDLVSILTPCCGQIEYTRLCVPSLLRHDDRPRELLFLDVGSLDGTADYLAGVAAAAAVRIEVVRTSTDLGIAAACQELLARARGDWLMLLNNDTVVTDQWLTHLVMLAGLAPEIALVGPMSNQAPPPQRVESVPYRLGPQRRPGSNEWVVDTAPVDGFAKQWREQHRGKWMEVEHLGGFCLLIKRAVLAQLGPLAGPAGLDVFDTDALCQKARAARLVLACCRDLFIHHFGSRTFSHGAPVDGQLHTT